LFQDEADQVPKQLGKLNASLAIMDVRKITSMGNSFFILESF